MEWKSHLICREGILLTIQFLILPDGLHVKEDSLDHSRIERPCYTVPCNNIMEDWCRDKFVLVVFARPRSASRDMGVEVSPPI